MGQLLYIDQATQDFLKLIAPDYRIAAGSFYAADDGSNHMHYYNSHSEGQFNIFTYQELLDVNKDGKVAIYWQPNLVARADERPDPEKKNICDQNIVAIRAHYLDFDFKSLQPKDADGHRLKDEDGKFIKIDLPDVRVQELKRANKDIIIKRYADLGITPTAVVETVNGYHLYFVLAEPVRHGRDGMSLAETYKTINKRLMQVVNDIVDEVGNPYADQLVCNIGRWLKMPGCKALNKQTGVALDIVPELMGGTYTHDQLCAVLPAIAEPATKAATQRHRADRQPVVATEKENKIKTTNVTTTPGRVELCLEYQPRTFLYRSQIKKALKQLNLREILDVPASGPFCCLFHADSNPSANITRNDDGYVYTCAAGCTSNPGAWDIIQIAMETRGLSYSDAIDWLMHNLGWTIGPNSKNTKNDKSEAKDYIIQHDARCQAYDGAAMPAMSFRLSPRVCNNLADAAEQIAHLDMGSILGVVGQDITCVLSALGHKHKTATAHITYNAADGYRYACDDGCAMDALDMIGIVAYYHGLTRHEATRWIMAQMGWTLANDTGVDTINPLRMLRDYPNLWKKIKKYMPELMHLKLLRDSHGQYFFNSIDTISYQTIKARSTVSSHMIVLDALGLINRHSGDGVPERLRESVARIKKDGKHADVMVYSIPAWTPELLHEAELIAKAMYRNALKMRGINATTLSRTLGVEMARKVYRRDAIRTRLNSRENALKDRIYAALRENMVYVPSSKDRWAYNQILPAMISRGDFLPAWTQINGRRYKGLARMRAVLPLIA